MTEQHVAIANVLANVRKQIGPRSTAEGTFDAIAYDLAELFRQRDPLHFDHPLFLNVCTMA